MMYCNCLPMLLALTSPAFAGEAHLGANTVATGGASTAYPSDNSAVSASPGMLALTERYDGMGFAALGPGLDYRLSGSAVDSRTARTAFGVSYRRTRNNLPLTSADLPGWTLDGQEPSNREEAHDVTIGVGVPFASRTVSVGFNTTLLWWKRERRGRGFSGNADLGIAWAAHDLFTTALTARNLLVFVEDEDMPWAGVLGMRVGDTERFMWVSDLEVLEGGRFGARTGLDGSAGPTRLRTGYAWDPLLGEHQWSWGIGAENEAGGFEYAMRVPIKASLDRGWAGILHTVSIRVSPPPLEPPEPR